MSRCSRASPGAWTRFSSSFVILCTRSKTPRCHEQTRWSSATLGVFCRTVASCGFVVVAKSLGPFAKHAVAQDMSSNSETFSSMRRCSQATITTKPARLRKIASFSAFSYSSSSGLAGVPGDLEPHAKLPTQHLSGDHGRRELRLRGAIRLLCRKWLLFGVFLALRSFWLAAAHASRVHCDLGGAETLNSHAPAVEREKKDRYRMG